MSSRCLKIGVLLFLFAAVSALPGQDAPDAIRYEKDIVYAVHGGEELKLDLALPAAADGPLPVVICIHGGGWRGGNRAIYTDFIKRLAAEGYAAATVSYRFAPAHRWPAQREDVEAALRWVRGQAKARGLDIARIGATGGSAGGHLALVLGLVPDASKDPLPPVQAVVNFFGPTDMARQVFNDEAERIIADLVGGPRAEKTEAIRSASPLHYITPGDAPVLTYHGGDDLLVPVTQAKVLHEALAGAGIPNRLEVLEGRSHGWGGEDLQRTLDGTVKYFDLYLKGSGAPLLAAEDFEDGAGRWETTDASAWKLAEGPGGKHFSLIKKQSDYRPKVRSPFNIALLRGVSVGDFVLDVKVQSTIPDYNHRDLCLFFGHQGPERFYYVHLGKRADPHAHSVFIVDGAPRLSIAKTRTEGIDWDDHWHRVRVRREAASGRIEVFFDDMEKPVMTAEDRTFTWGRIGIGSFDDTGNFDEIRLRGVRVD